MWRGWLQTALHQPPHTSELTIDERAHLWKGVHFLAAYELEVLERPAGDVVGVRNGLTNGKPAKYVVKHALTEPVEYSLTSVCLLETRCVAAFRHFQPSTHWYEFEADARMRRGVLLGGSVPR